MIDRLRRLVRRKAAETRAKLTFFPEHLKAMWTRWDWRTLVDEGYAGSAPVFACIRVWANNYPEPPMRAYREDGDDREVIPEHPARLLLERPNPFMTEVEMWERVITYASVGGAAYWWKERANDESVIRLWVFHAGQVSPVPDPDAYLSHFVYDAGDGLTFALRPEDVIQFQWAPDPLNPLVGLPPIVAAGRSVDTSSEAERYVHALLKNDATPRTGLVVNTVLPDHVYERMVEQFEQDYGGDNRGRPMLIEGQEGSVVRIGANLKELEAEALHNVPQSNIAASFGGAPVGYMAGLNVHLQRSIYSNMKEAREGLTEDVLIPMWRKASALLTVRLMREDFDDDPAMVLDFDLSKVRSLREDQDAIRARARSDFQAGILTRNQALLEAGRSEADGGDVYLIDVNKIEVAATGDVVRQPTRVTEVIETSKAFDAAVTKALTDRESVARARADREALVEEAADEIEAALAKVQADAARRARGNGSA